MKANYADAKCIVRILNRSKYETYLAGGCVRDLLLGLDPSDFDVATAATPEEVQEICEAEGIRTVPVGTSFGVIKAIIDGRELDIASFRVDGKYTDHRRPDKVTYTSSAEEDVKRRDFTINAMLMDEYERITDHVGGQQDLQRRVLRCVGDPVARFTEDALRMMRAIRFAVRFNLSIDPATLSAIRDKASTIDKVSKERITEELTKTFAYGNCERAYVMLRINTRLWQEWFGAAPRHDVSWMSLKGLSQVQPGDPFTLVLAIILGQDWLSDREKQTQALTLTNAQRAEFNSLIEHSKELRTFMLDPLCEKRTMLQWPNLDLILKFMEYQSHLSDYEFSKSDNQTDEDVKKAMASTKALGFPEPLINGDWLINAGYIQGPIFTKMLESVRTAQLNEELKDVTEVPNHLTKYFPCVPRKLRDGTILDGMSPVTMIAVCKCGLTMTFKVGFHPNGKADWSTMSDKHGIRGSGSWHYLECSACWARKAKTSFVKVQI